VGAILRPLVVRPAREIAKPRPADTPATGGDLDLDAIAVEVTPPKSGGRKADKPDSGDRGAGEMLAETADIVARLETMRRWAEAHDRSSDGASPPAFATGTLTTEDDEFGPWYGEEPLPVGRNGASQLPTGAGGAGTQQWFYVSTWKAVGPFPVRRFDLDTPLLPDVAFSLRARFKADLSELKQGSAYKGGSTLGWEPCHGPRTAYVGAMRSFGVMGPPNYSSRNRVYTGCGPMLGGYLPHSGMEDSTAFLAAEIESPEDVELWVGLGVNERAKLWVNDQPAWLSPANHHDNYAEAVALRRMAFRKGLNRLLMRLDVDYSSPFVWMRVCTRGGPRPAAEVRAKADAMAAKRRALRPSVAVGWRKDGNGLYAADNPPLAWDPKRMHNVLWKTPLDYWSNSTPVPIPGSDRVALTMNLHWLLCLNKDTGKELWRRRVSLLDLLPDAEREEGERLYEAWWKLRLECDALPASEVRPEKWWRDTWYWAEGTGAWRPAPPRDEKKGASPELLALLAKREQLEKAEDPTAVADELAAASEQIEKLKAKAAEVDPASPQALVTRTHKAYDAFFAFLQKRCAVQQGAGYWPDYSGFTFPTPVTDGRHIWVRANMDALACFDLDGNRQWMVRTYDASGGDHNMSSPLLVDDKLVLQMQPVPGAETEGDAAFRKGRNRPTVLKAYDAATGAVRWTTRDIPHPDWNCSTPAVLTLTDGAETMRVLVTGAGTVVRADDGKVLVNDMGLFNAFPSLVHTNDIVLFSAPHLCPVRLIMKDRDTVGFQRLWACEAGFHGNQIGGTVLADGLILLTGWVGPSGRRYGEEPRIQVLRAAGGPSEAWKGAEVRDLRDGLVTGSVIMNRKSGHQYAPPFATARHFYSVIGDTIFVGGNPKPPLWVNTLTRERQPLMLAANPIDRTCGSGAVEADRIYFAGHSFAMCVGYTGDAGRAFEARTVARTLLEQMANERLAPPAGEPVQPVARTESALARAPYGDRRYVDKSGPTLVLPGQPPHSWWVLGPFPAGRTDAALKAIGGPGAVVRGNEPVTVDGQTVEWGPLSQSWMRSSRHRQWERDASNFTDIHRTRRMVDLTTALDGRERTAWLLLTEWQSDAKQVARFEQTLPGARAWIGGKPVAHGDRVALDAGCYPLMLAIEVDTLPADGSWLSPCFWGSDDPKREEAEWLTFARRTKPYLEECVRRAPDSVESAAARHVLAGL
jgi:hypothetical protein